MKAAFANAPVHITFGEGALDPAPAQRVTSILVRQRLSAPSAAEITFAEPPDAFVNGLGFGTPVRLATGADDVLFEGETTAIEHERDGAEGHIVRVRAYDRLHRLRKKQRARVAQSASISQFLSDTVSEIGLACDAAESGPVRGLIVQYEQSDLDLLAALAADAGLFFYLDRDTLRLTSLAGQGDALDLKVGHELSVARATASADAMRRSTATKAWDVLHTGVVDASAAVARQDTNDVHGLDTTAFGDVGKRTLFNRIANDAGEAQALAQADLDRSAARDVIIEATAMGRPDIRPGCIVNIQGMSDNIDGRYTVTVAEHTITEASGYLTAFSTEPPRVTRSDRACPAFTFGTVTEVNDPERLSRVRVKLPLLGDLESAWMPVVIPGAGLEKGLAVLPEVDDEVLIVFPQGDPAYGIVLGGLYGTRKAPGLVDSGTRPFAFRTGNGQSITLDAEKGLARIETSGGDVLELGPDGAKIHATRDLVIEAPGRKLTVRANAIEFERG
jgi:uncharacterized protein involved in type VI secretion and phage assembly